MNRKKSIIKLVLFLVLFAVFPKSVLADYCAQGTAEYDYVKCVAAGKTPYKPTHKVDDPGSKGSIPRNNSGIMFSMVDENGNRLPGTTSYIIQDSGNSVAGYRILKTYMTKKEVRNGNIGYVTNEANWSVNKNKIHRPVVPLEEYVWSTTQNDCCGSQGYILHWLDSKTYKDKPLWMYYAEACGYDYDNYTYDQIQNHYLMFEPMTAFVVGTNGKKAGTYFATMEQALRIRLANGSSGMDNLATMVRNLSLAIYIPTSGLSFNKVTKTSKLNYNDYKSNAGYGMGYINVGLSCEKAGLDCGRPTCDITINSHFPVDSNTGKVQSVIIDPKDETKVTIVADGTEGSYNCCTELLQTEFGNDKSRLCDERPECCYDVPCAPSQEDNLTSCTTNTSGKFSNPGKDDQDTWYCMKSFDQYSPYVEKIINQYARIVCREDLKVTFPSQLDAMQSVGTYMVWPTSNKSINNDNPLIFDGTMTCKLSIDKAEIDATGNGNNIYNDIYKKVLSYTNNNNCSYSDNCEAKNWYKLNNNIKLNVSYNDDEYGGKQVSLDTDTAASTVSLTNLKPNASGYEKVNGLTIYINNRKSYKLNDQTYKILTSSGTGSKNLSNMYDKINKNYFVYKKFYYGILPISYTAKVTRNYTVNKTDYYKLTLSYENIGDDGRFAIGEKLYTCPYEVTFAPPTNTEDDKDGLEFSDDNNNSYEKFPNGTCVCPEGTAHCSMDLRGYLIKNSKMTCKQAQAIYCNSDRGNMNVEYRVISLTEPFPGSGETAKTMAQGGRDIGYNWRDSVDQTTSGGVVSTFILNNRRVKGYEVYNLEPLYVIELDSAKIKAIRDYNKTTTYADFNLTCVNDKDGTICTSPFLDQYVSSGTCHTAHTKDKFYKCADKDIPASENK